MSLAPAIEKTEAIALRVSDFSNTSQMVAWLTPEGRRLVTSAKGALRPRSPFLGQFDVCYTCEVLYYAHGGASGAVHVLHECTPLDTRAALRHRWRAALAATYATDLVGHVAESAPPTPALYSLLRAALDQLARHGTSAAALLAFETRLLAVLGLAPDLVGCPHCLDTALARGARFSVPEGRIVCPDCASDTVASMTSTTELTGSPPDGFARAAPRAGGSAEITLPQRLLAPLRLAFGADVYAPGVFARLDAADANLLRSFLGAFLHYHLDARLDGRAIAWDALAARPLPAAPRPVRP